MQDLELESVDVFSLMLTAYGFGHPMDEVVGNICLNSFSRRLAVNNFVVIFDHP